jgi:hypothetical protein
VIRMAMEKSLILFLFMLIPFFVLMKWYLSQNHAVLMIIHCTNEVAYIVKNYNNKNIVQVIGGQNE